MKLLPWRERVTDARCELDAARSQKEQVKSNRRLVKAIADELKRHEDANGWTEAITKIWGSTA